MTWQMNAIHFSTFVERASIRIQFLGPFTLYPTEEITHLFHVKLTHISPEDASTLESSVGNCVALLSTYPEKFGSILL